MHAGVRARLTNRLLSLAILGVLFSLPANAQYGQLRPRASTAAASEATQALDVQDTQEPIAKQQPDPAPPLPAKRDKPNPVKNAASGSIKSPATAAARNVIPTQAEPELPIVPPPPSPAPQNSEPAPARIDTRGAAPQDSEKTDTATPVQGMGWLDIARAFGSVGLIVCLILGGYMLIRRFAPQYVAKRPAERELRLVETLPMGEKRSIVVVQAGAHRFLLGCTPGQISLLTPLNATAATAPAGAKDTADIPAAAALSGNFRNLYEQEKKTAPARPSVVKALPPDVRGKMLELRKALEG